MRALFMVLTWSIGMAVGGAVRSTSGDGTLIDLLAMAASVGLGLAVFAAVHDRS